MNLEQWEAIERWRIYHEQEMARVQREHLIRLCLAGAIWLVACTVVVLVVTS